MKSTVYEAKPPKSGLILRSINLVIQYRNIESTSVKLALRLVVVNSVTKSFCILHIFVEEAFPTNPLNRK